MNKYSILHSARAWRLPLIAALMAASLASPALAAPAAAKAQPQLLEVARTQPGRRVAVIVQKADASNAALALTSRLGGRVTMVLDIINAFAAELPAESVEALTRSAAVRWVSLDGVMVGSNWNGDSAQPGQSGAYQVTVNAGQPVTASTDSLQVAIGGGGAPQSSDTLGTMPLQTMPVVQVGKDGASVVVPALPADAGRMGAEGEIVPAQPLSDEQPAPALAVDQKRYATAAGDQSVNASNLRNVYQGTVRATNAWQAGYTGSGVGVAVLDSGVNGGYEDFYNANWQSRVTANVGFDVDNNADMGCSTGAGSNVPLTFVNNSSRRVNVYWRDGNCNEIYYGDIWPYGNNFWLSTYNNHMWVIRDADTNAVMKTHKVYGGATVSIGDLDTSDPFGHGTHVAGIIGGSGRAGDGRAYAGTAPNANLINVRVIKNDGSTRASNVVAGMQWILQNKARYNIRVVNISMNSSSYESYHTNPLCAAAEVLWFNGIVVVVSSGNKGGGNLFPPANDPFVITVGATDDKGTASRSDDTLAGFSAYGVADGISKPDLVAPGRWIKSSMPWGVLAQDGRAKWVESDYYKMSGTSMAAPVVAGAAAILLGKEPWLTPDQVKYRLKYTATPFVNTTVAGAGLLDVYKAVTTASSASANTGTPMSRLLTGGSTTTWASVSWSSVSWSSVSWSSVSWSSVSWSSDYREP